MQLRRPLASALGIAALTVALAGCGGGGEGAGQAPGGGIGPQGELSVQLTELEGSGQSGNASIAASEEGSTNVIVELSGSQGISSQPAGIYRGTCGQLEGEPEYELPNLEEGFAAGTVEAPFDQLIRGGFVLSVAESTEQPDKQVACGEIRGA